MIKLTDDIKANQLYMQIKQIILEKEKNSSYKYESSQYLDKRDVDEEIKKLYLREEGEITFENINGDLVTAKISRWHQYKRWSRYGIYEVPSFKAEIYIGNQLIWNLTSYCRDSFKGECSENKVSSLDIPLSILQEKENPFQESNDEQIIDETEEKKNIDVIPQETRILFNEVKTLQNLYFNEQQEAEVLLDERTKKIEQETKRIMKEYEEKIKLNKTQNSVTKKQLKEFEKDISNYSSFNLETLGKCLEKLISVFEGDKFIYEEAIHEENTRIHGTMDSWDETVENKVKMIVREPKYKSNYFSKSCSNNVINNLVNNGDAIILTETNNHSRFSTKICIYALIDNQLVSSVNFDKFDYIKEFIDNIIQFRFENKKKDFNEEDMQEQMKKFLLDYKDRILENQKQKFEEKVLTLKI